MQTKNDQLQARIYFLDYARIFAFTSVLIGHLFNKDLEELAANQGVHVLFRQLAGAIHYICAFGGAGVVVFFITSGYIITHVIRNEAPVDFIIRRIFRIYPLFIFAAITELSLAAATQNTPFPPLRELIPRLLLIGDFTGTAYGLGGVEWTLRIELLFYIFMAILRTAGLFRQEKSTPALLFLVALGIFALPTFPNSFEWTDGYFNIFFPFLIIGVLFYYLENSGLKKWSFTLFVAAIFLGTLLRTQALQPKLIGNNFELIALFTFWALWLFRKRMRGHLVVRTLSDMTYAVYLFHLWSWAYLGQFVEKYGVGLIPDRLQRLMLLLAFCLLATKTVEKYGIKLGRIAGRKLNGRTHGA